MNTKLDNDQARAMLRRGRIARLGCCVDGEPYVTPVNYLFDGESVLVHSLPGRKIWAMRTNPRVCLQIDEIEDEFDWKSVLAFGTYEEITDPADRSEAIRSLLARFPQLTPVETLIAEDAGAPEPIVFRICINSLSGIREGRPQE
jgi:nitroimidazol reductase NimA-like FMN-containing flavoprotein (pyridoxamine 5'-phosphate oxidase superfamily)